MNFRRLEIIGFKSFADKIEIEFEPGTTAVVGPNGCGKSNICDAIKWALGEQNAKSLRCEKMESIIFNGGSDRRQLGMAQVNLTITNSEKELQSEYTDVEITRRLFRSGESEYYINKNRCLLKDIQEIFMDTGLGVNSYSIMEQGHIDLILNSSPQDRRLILEEAAGITKFRHRKRVALKKLETTEQNLLRVNDILYELENQVSSLKRQASKAKRYQENLSELKALDTKLSLKKYKTLNEEFNSIQNKLENSDDRINSLIASTSKIESQLESYRLEITESEANLADLRLQERQEQNRIEETESKIAVLKERKANLQQRQKMAMDELSKLQRQLEDSESQIASLTVEKGKLGESIQSQEKELILLQERADKLTQSVAIGEKELNDLKSQTIEILNKKARAQNELSSITSRLDYLITRLQRLEANVENFHNEKAETESAIAKIQEELQEKENIINSLTTKQKQIETEIRQSQARLSLLDKNIREVEQSRNAKGSRLQSLKELQEAHEGYNAGVKAILGKKPGRSLNGIFCAVAEIIRTQAKYEAAIEASLGNSLQDILTGNLEDAVDALGYLKEGRLGRATFLPMDMIKSTRGQVFPEPLPDGILAVASRVVEFDPAYQGLVEHLLGDTLIVENIDSALKVFREIKDKFQLKIATLDGEIISSRGSVTGGSGSESSGLLRRSREIVELTKDVANLDDQLDKLDGDRHYAVSELSNLQKEKDKTSREFQKEQISYGGLQKDILQNKQRLTRLEKEISVIESERDSLEKEILVLEESKAKAQQNTGEFEEQSGEIEKRINALQAEIKSRIQERDAVTQQCTNARIQIASRKQQEKGLAEKLRSLEQAKDKLTQSLSHHQTSAFSDSQAEKEISEDIETQEKILEDLFSNRSKIESEISKSDTQRQKAQLELAQGESAIRENRRELDQINQSKYQLEVNKTQIKMNIDALILKMRERYGISLETQQEDNQEIPEEEAELNARIDEIRGRMDNMGSVNLTAIDEYNRQKERYDLMVTQKEDLIKAKESLYGIIQRINKESRDRLKETYDSVNASFQELFRRLFGGGHAELTMDTEGDVLESGVDIIAQPPGKKPQSISMLSSGERTLTAIAILFALFKSKPSPFCVLDEVDAALDDANVGRFSEMVKEFSKDTQFIIITHNKRTMEIADVLYGITMEEPGVSKIVSLRMNNGDNASQAAD